VITEAGNDPKVAALVHIAAFARSGWAVQGGPFAASSHPGSTDRAGPDTAGAVADAVAEVTNWAQNAHKHEYATFERVPDRVRERRERR
jgi:hypothetical protein